MDSTKADRELTDLTDVKEDYKRGVGSGVAVVAVVVRERNRGAHHARSSVTPTTDRLLSSGFPSPTLHVLCCGYMPGVTAS